MTIYRPDHFGNYRSDVLEVEPGEFHYQDRWNGCLHSFGIWLSDKMEKTAFTFIN